ncbi:MAG: hypothetical protein ACFFBV_11955 [Promethearchaeota archaeon]
MECWNIGCRKRRKYSFGSGVLRLRIASLRQEAKNSWPSASSPPPRGRFSNLFQGNTYPWTHHSNILAEEA